MHHHIEHMQVTLYQLLMDERYGEHIDTGILWHLSQAMPELVTRSVGAWKDQV